MEVLLYKEINPIISGTLRSSVNPNRTLYVASQTTLLHRKRLNKSGFSVFGLLYVFFVPKGNCLDFYCNYHQFACLLFVSLFCPESAKD